MWIPTTKKIREDQPALRQERDGEIVAVFAEAELRDRVAKLLRDDDRERRNKEKRMKGAIDALNEKRRGSKATVKNPVPSYAEVVIRYRDDTTATLQTYTGHEAGKQARQRADEWNEKYG